MGNKWVLCVRTAYSYGHSFRPFTFEHEKTTPQCVYSAGHWNRAVRYHKRDYKFKFFDTEAEATRELRLMNIRCKVTDAERIQKEATAAKRLADELVKRELLEWA